jgi:hypothetical protein
MIQSALDSWMYGDNKENRECFSSELNWSAGGYKEN